LPARATASLRGPQAGISPELIRSQSKAGHKMRELGLRLESEEFTAKALDGRIKATFNGLQQLQHVAVAADAAQAVGGSRKDLAEALLAALQEAHSRSQAGSEGDVWQLYKENPDLLQAPLVQIGAGATAEDLWANVEQSEETIQLAEELFDHFDADGDGYWNLKETSAVQRATEGTEMSEDAFSSLIIAVADNRGRDLVEDDLALGLSRQQVVDLYTNAERQKSLGFVLDIYKDHTAVFFAAESGSDGPGEQAQLEVHPDG